MTNIIFLSAACVFGGYLIGIFIGTKRAFKAEDRSDRYLFAILDLDRWCGHQFPAARVIAKHLKAVGEGKAINAGTPHGEEPCTVMGLREQLRRLEAKAALPEEDAELLAQARELQEAFTEAVVPRDGTLIERMQYLGRYVVALKKAEFQATKAVRPACYILPSALEWMRESPVGKVGTRLHASPTAQISLALYTVPPVASLDELNEAARDVLAERRRQQEIEGWTTEHDDEHVSGEISALAAFYAMPPAARDWDASSTGYGETLGEAMLPPEWRAKPGERREELKKAGALILAEIERIDRATLAERNSR